MDTPEKSETQNGTPNSKRKDEDSPVTNYKNSPSPLKTAKFITIAETLGSHSHSLPSSSFVFASPHASPLKGSCASWITEEEKKKALLETDPPQSLKDDCNTPGVINDAAEAVSNNNDLSILLRGLRRRCLNATEMSLLDNNVGNENLLDNNVGNEYLLYNTVDNEYSFSGNLKVSLQGSTTPFLSLEDDIVKESESGKEIPKSIEEVAGNNQQPLGESSSSFLVPSIGQHLNAIAMSSKDNDAGNEYSVSGNIKVRLQRSTTPLLCLEDDIVRESESGKEIPKSVVEESNPVSPKKKRRKSGQSGLCNCKRSKCLKLYCDCFAAGVYCIEPCSCVDCFNKPIHEDTVLATRQQIESRNPLAFAPKVIRSSDSIIEVGEDASKTPPSARHKRGCNCRKSNCLKRYCECYQVGVGCSIDCRCEGCKNIYGRKAGSAGDQDKENQTSGINQTAKTQQNVELFNLAAPVSTPLPLRQPLAQHPIPSNNRLLPLQSHLHHGASGSSNIIREPDMSTLPHSGIGTITENTDDDTSHENIIQTSLPHEDSPES